MFDASLYAPIYIYFCFAVTLITTGYYINISNGSGSAKNYNQLMLGLTAGFIILFLGTRPISGAYFLDMGTYAEIFERAKITGNAGEADWLFGSFVLVTGRLFTVETFFLLCTFLYIVSTLIATLRVHGHWAFAVFLSLLGGFQCYPYIVNGIRNGIACAILLLAYSYRDRKLTMFILMGAAAGFHKSTLLPAAAFLIADIVPNLFLWASGWFACFVLSAIGGAGFTQFLGGFFAFGEDERATSYTATNAFGGMGKAGFRLDFIAYSIFPIIITYLLVKKEVKRDPFYQRLLCTYLISNSFWLLLIYSEFSNRFAYLSWFMLPWVIVYPFLPLRNGQNNKPSKYLGSVIFSHFLFTFAMYLYYQQR